MSTEEEPNATLLPTPLEARILVSEILIILQERLDREITAQETTRQMEEAVTRSLERHAATLKAERDEAREKLRKALATLKRIGCNQSRYYGSEAMNMFNELTS